MRRQKDTNRHKADGPDFNTPTPHGLRRKMVNWRDVVLRLMREFPRADVRAVRRLNPPDRRSLLDLPPVAAAAEFEDDVLSRKRELERMAFFRNADIKFGLRRGKGLWWRHEAAAIA
jgi:hypothetical protein